MKNKKINLNNQQIDNIKEMCVKLNVVSVYDLDVYTSMELYYMLANKVNEIIKELWRFETTLTDELIEQNKELELLLNEGLIIEVTNKVLELIENGTIKNLINKEIFNGLDEKISDLYKNKADDSKVVKKGYGTLNDFDEATRAILLGLAQGSINAVLGYKNVIPFNTTFFKHGVNMFNKDVCTDNAYVVDSTGEIETRSATNFFVSDYMDIEGLTTIKSNGLLWHYAFYDTSKKYMSGSSIKTKEISVPNGSKWVRVSMFGLEYKNTLMLYDGSLNIIDYESYYEFIPLKYTEANNFTIDDIKELSLSKMEFSEQTSNLFNKNTLLTDKYIDSSTGNLVTTNGFIASDFIEVESSSKYVIKSLRHYAFYDENKNFVSGGESVSSDYALTTPPNCCYLRFSFYPPADGVTIDTQQVNKGETLLPFEEYGFYIPSKYLENNNKIDNEKELQINLPKTLYVVPNKELRIKFASVFTDYYKGVYDIKVNCTKGKQGEIEWIYTPTGIETFSLTISVYKDDEVILSKQITVKVVNDISTEKSLKGLFLGDSTTAHGYYPKNFKNLCDNNGNIKLNLIGTRTSLGVQNEGRSGWTIKQYCTITNDSNYNNPFYNSSTNKFDFSQYMEQQSYSNLDFVNIHLGINDIFASYNENQTIDYMKQIIDSIRHYDQNIKILLNIVIPPNPSQDIWGDAYGCSKALWEYYRDYNKFLKLLIGKYENKENENIYLIGINAILGYIEEYQDAVHGKYEDSIGAYQKMAEQTYYALNYIYQ